VKGFRTEAGIFELRKSSAMNRLERITSMHIMLQTKRLIRASEMAEKFGVSLRTVYRDIRTLEEAGVPIISEAGLGYSLVSGYNLPPIHFTQEEANTMLLGAKVLEPFSDASVQKAYGNALDKIRAVLKTVQKDELEVLDQQVKVLQSFAGPQNVTENLVKIQQALIGRHVIEIAYNSSYKGEHSKRKVEPIGLTFYGNYWHLIAWCQLRSGYRDFRTDRIDEITFTMDSFKLNSHLGLEEYLENLEKQTEATKVVLKIKKSAYHFLVNQKYTLGFISDRDLGDKMEVEFLTGSLHFFAQNLLMWGSVAEIVEPQELKDMLGFLLVELNSHYKQVVF